MVRVVFILVRVAFLLGIGATAGYPIALLLELFDELVFQEQRTFASYWFFGSALGLTLMAPLMRGVAGGESGARRRRRQSNLEPLSRDRIDLVDELEAARARGPSNKAAAEARRVVAVCKNCGKENDVSELDLDQPQCWLCGSAALEVKPTQADQAP